MGFVCADAEWKKEGKKEKKTFHINALLLDSFFKRTLYGTPPTKKVFKCRGKLSLMLFRKFLKTKVALLRSFIN